MQSDRDIKFGSERAMVCISQDGESAQPIVQIPKHAFRGSCKANRQS